MDSTSTPTKKILSNGHRIKWFGCLILAVAFLASALPVHADLVFMKDGFVLQGKVRRDHQIELDPATKEPIAYPKGFFQVDDGVRRQYFLPSQARIAEKDQPESEEKFSFPKVIFIPHGRPMPSIWEIVQSDDWDDKWDRSFIFKGPGGLVGMRHHLGTVTPTWARVDAINRHRWGCMYLTTEFSDQTLRKLLDSNPDAMDKPDAPAKDRLLRSAKRLNFFVQAGRLSEAENELARIAGFGKEGETILEKSKGTVAALKNNQILTVAKRYSKSGQYKQAKEILSGLPSENTDERLSEDLRTISADADAALEREVRARGLLNKVASMLAKDDPLVRPLESVIGEFHLDGLDRLEGFLGQADSLTGMGKAESVPENTRKMAALAISGWMLGKAAAEDKPARAVQVSDLRAKLLTALRLPGKTARDKFVDAELNSASISKDDLFLMIPNLPPVLGDATVAPSQVKEMVPDSGERGEPRYHVLLPPGYHPGKKWPLLVVLHGSGEKPEDHLKKWSVLAGQEGYVLVAPHWELGGAKSGYAYSPNEHDAVLGAIRSAKSRFRLDDDKVFLFGLDGGANAAFDIGLAHPDWFAGVIPMSGGAFYFPMAYWRNAQQVPFYVCNGDYAGDLNLKNREIFTSWASRSFPMIWTQYKGRGVEWFAGEVPQIFDWMRPKRRQYSLTGLGNGGGLGVLGNDYRTLRPTDDRFYWIGAGDTSKTTQMTGSQWNPSIQPATIAAWVDKGANRINVRTSGVNEVMVRLVRNAAGESVVRMDQPVSIQHKVSTVWSQKSIQPDIATMLDEVATRGEREILVLKVIRFKPT